MTNSPETSRRKPRMIQGRKAGERPPDDPKYLLHESGRLKLKKIQEILERERNED